MNGIGIGIGGIHGIGVRDGIHYFCMRLPHVGRKTCSTAAKLVSPPMALVDGWQLSEWVPALWRILALGVGRSRPKAPVCSESVPISL